MLHTQVEKKTKLLCSFSTGVILTSLPYAQNVLYIISSLLRMMCRELPNLYFEKCRSKVLQIMIYIFTDC